QALELFAKLGGVFGTEFAGFHYQVSLSTDMTRHEGRRDRQLSGGQAESFTCKLFAYTFHFVQHLAGLNFCDPELRITFPVTHTDFSRLLRNGLVRENADPDPA